MKKPHIKYCGKGLWQCRHKRHPYGFIIHGFGENPALAYKDYKRRLDSLTKV